MAIVRTRRIIDNDGAASVLAAAEQKARETGARVVLAVVDPWGELIELRRTPGAQIASSRVAVDKARTAAIFVRPSREIEEQVSSGRLGALALHGAAALTGGSMVDPREVAPGELRAPAVQGGRRRELSEGDVLAIPNGVPHQFTDVSDPFLYFVVKVAA